MTAAEPPTTSVSCRAPSRIDLAGGTLDIWPICQLEPGTVTVNLAIDLYATATVRVRDDGAFVFASTDRDAHEFHDGHAAARASRALPLHREVALHFGRETGLELTTASGVPNGSGLGGSSTLLVAAIAAAARATGVPLTPDDLLRRAVNLETRVLGVPAGTQDYLAAIHGGLGVIHFPAEGPRRDRLPVDTAAVESRLVLVDTGQAHFSGTNNWAITKAYVDGDEAVRRHVRSIATAARELAHALRAGDLDAAGAAIDAEWTARRLLAPGVSTPRIERLGRAGRAAGALAMKVCGAGGGGCLFLWCREGARDDVSRALRDEGAPVLAFRTATEGVE